jgi:hypothetical protein
VTGVFAPGPWWIATLWGAFTAVLLYRLMRELVSGESRVGGRWIGPDHVTRAEEPHYYWVGILIRFIFVALGLSLFLKSLSLT